MFDFNKATDLELVSYFVEKFSAIPDEKWAVGAFNIVETDKCCALGLCGVRIGRSTEEGQALNLLFDNYIGISPVVPEVNDGTALSYQQETPKLRILAALEDIRNRIIEEMACERNS